MMPEAISPEERDTLRKVREQLLHLHKLLLDRERARYEHARGAISSPNEFLHLALHDTQFEWLRQLSGTIVQLDEMLAPRSTAGSEDARSAREQIRILLTPREEGADFERNYWAALQDSPDAIFLHREIVRLVGSG